MELGVVVGVVLIGFIHGVLPDHGWPIAATYALNRKRRWLYGFLAALILGVGHLISSVLLVLAYFWFSTFADFAEGPWLGVVAGSLLILLGIHEYRNGAHGMHEHGDGHGEHDHDHSNDDHHGHGEHGHDDHHGHGEHGHDDHHGHGEHGHGNDESLDHGGHDHGHAHAIDTDGSGHGHHVHDEHDHHDHDHHTHDEHDHHGHHADERDTGVLARIRSALPWGGGHQHLTEEHAERGLAALGITALLLGFAHEEPVQILAICVGTDACLELMLIYSIAVIIAIIVPTLLLIAGYEHHRERIERYTPYLPTVTAVVLIGMGLAFITGLL